MGGQTSVIIPCYDTPPHYLAEAVASVREQTTAAREILVIDDGSAVPAAVAASPGPPVRVFRQPNRGLAAARNAGLREASGRYVAFLDSDDHWSPGKLAAQEAALDADPAAAACYTRCVESPGYFGFGPYPPPGVGRGEFAAVLWHHMFFPPSAVLVRRSALDAAGPFREGMLNGEDFELFFRLLAVGPFAQVPEPLTHYRRHAGQLTGDPYRTHRGMYQARAAVLGRHRDLLVAAGLPAGRLWDAHRDQLLLLFYRRQFPAARRLLWHFLSRHPAHVSLLKPALLSLLPAALIERWRGRAGFADPAPPAGLSPEGREARNAARWRDCRDRLPT